MLYIVGFFLLFIIVLVIITVSVLRKSKSKDDGVQEQKHKPFTLDDLLKILKTQKQDRAKIEEVLVLMTENFPFPENENEANKYFEFVYFFAKNPLTTAKLIVKMQKDLSEANPKYKKQIEDFQMRGVEARNR